MDYKALSEIIKKERIGNHRNDICPVCLTKMKYSCDTMGSITMEEQYVCPNQCYSYEYVTGSTRIEVGRAEFTYHYTSDQEELKRLYMLIELAIIFERENANAKKKLG